MIDIVASRPHYLDHVAPVWHALGDLRGRFCVPPDLEARARRAGIEPSPIKGPLGHTLVAGATDVTLARRHQATAIARMEHGVGQSYAGDAGWARHSSYPGGKHQEAVSLFLAPNAQAAARWRRFYPEAMVEVIGATRLLPRLQGEPCVAIAFHWEGPIPETRSAFRFYEGVLTSLDVPLIVHAHPRAKAVREKLIAMGLEFVEDLEEVARRATVFATDNSSTLYEMAVARPVVALNAPWYRPDADHGLRFGPDALIPGAVVNDPAKLGPTLKALLEGEPPALWAHRHNVIREVIPHADGAQRAATLLMAWSRARARVAA